MIFGSEYFSFCSHDCLNCVFVEMSLIICDIVLEILTQKFNFFRKKWFLASLIAASMNGSEIISSSCEDVSSVFCPLLLLLLSPSRFILNAFQIIGLFSSFNFFVGLCHLSFFFKFIFFFTNLYLHVNLNVSPHLSHFLCHCCFTMQ